MADHPMEDCILEAQKLVHDGHQIFQKFTCAKCGERLTIDEPNKFYTHGTCHVCGTLTDIRINGCNYMLITNSGEPGGQLTLCVHTPKGTEDA